MRENAQEQTKERKHLEMPNKPVNASKIISFYVSCIASSSSSSENELSVNLLEDLNKQNSE